MLKTKIILVDDHQLVIDGFKMLLSNQQHIEVVGVANNGKNAISLCETLNPDLVLMDINLPILNGIDATQKIKKKYPQTKIIILSMNENEEFVYKADQAGADGYLLKNMDVEELLIAIKTVVSGNNYYSKSLDADIIFKVINKKYLRKDAEKNIFTKRELELIHALSKGKSNKEIAESLFISDRTVNTHKTNIYKKLSVKNSVELLVKAKAKGLI